MPLPRGGALRDNGQGPLYFGRLSTFGRIVALHINAFVRRTLECFGSKFTVAGCRSLASAGTSYGRPDESGIDRTRLLPGKWQYRSTPHDRGRPGFAWSETRRRTCDG